MKHLHRSALLALALGLGQTWTQAATSAAAAGDDVAQPAMRIAVDPATGRARPLEIEERGASASSQDRGLAVRARPEVKRLLRPAAGGTGVVLGASSMSHQVVCLDPTTTSRAVACEPTAHPEAADAR